MKALIQAAFKRIRESEELGKDSLSTYDECYEDDELVLEIEQLIEENPSWTVEEIFEWCLDLEQIRRDRDREVRYDW